MADAGYPLEPWDYEGYEEDEPNPYAGPEHRLDHR
jgi:hypothetical protein